jgi:hypothetical protein
MQSLFDLAHNVIDHDSGFSSAESFMRKRAEAASTDSRVAERVRQDPDEQTSSGVVP